MDSTELKEDLARYERLRDQAAANLNAIIGVVQYLREKLATQQNEEAQQTEIEVEDA